MDLWRSLVRKFSRSSRVTSANDDDDDDFRIATQAPLSSNQNQFVDVESLYTAVASGEVLLLSGLWLLKRAGYTIGSKSKGGRWVVTDSALPLPNRQQLEADTALVAVATLDAHALRRQHAALLETVRCACNDYDDRSGTEDGLDAAPIVAASHCWSAAEHADADGVTLRAVAKALAERWATFERWGLDDVGVFFDWSSLYQNHPVPRTDAQDAIFRAALQNMSIWYAHRLTSVVIVTGQRVPTPREDRGWPYYEESVARLFKEEPRGSGYTWRSDGGGAPVPMPVAQGAPQRKTRNLKTFWSKVIVVDAATGVVSPITAGNMGHLSDTSITRWERRKPPLPASEFDRQCQHKVFTSGADTAIVSQLYGSCLREGFKGVTQLTFPRLGWGDAEVEQLGATLLELSTPHCALLKLSVMPFTHLDALGRAIERGALPNLRVLVLAACTKLRRLPAALGRLVRLESLVLSECVQLEALPASLAELPALKLLDLRGGTGGTGVRLTQPGCRNSLHASVHASTRTSLWVVHVEVRGHF